MGFPGLAERVADVRARIAAAVTRGGHGQQVAIVAVTKTHGPDAATAAYEVGLHDVGENKVQEALKKMDRVEVPVRWHLIGHLQRNKVKSLERFVLLHSLDSARLVDAGEPVLTADDASRVASLATRLRDREFQLRLLDLAARIRAKAR